MRIKLTQLAVVVAASAGMSTSVFAIDPQSIRVSDGLMFTPTLKFEQRHDDNIFATRNNRKSSWVSVIEPTFALSLDRAKSAHELKYRMSSKNFHASNSNSYIDHHLTANSGFEFNSRNRLMLNAGYHKLEDTASDVSSLTAQGRNDKWNTKNVGGVYTYGARTARAQVDLGLDYNELRYDNSARIDGERINRNLERDTTGGRITGYYVIAPKTKLLLEGRYTDYDYINDNTRDNKTNALLAGVTWEATAKTSGTVKVGREKINYKESGRSSTSTSMWEAGVTWAPRTYSTFDLKTRRGYDEGNTNIYDYDQEFDILEPIDSVSQTIRTVDSQLTWRHYWMDRLYSTAEYRRIDRKYQRANGREDKIDQYGLGLTFQARRWLDIGIGYKHRENDSDVRDQSYKRNIYALTFHVSL